MDRTKQMIKAIINTYKNIDSFTSNDFNKPRKITKTSLNVK